MNKETEQRTIKQNKSLHKYCDMVANALNDAGLDMSVVMIGDYERIKKPIKNATNKYLYGKQSEDLTNEIMDIIYGYLARMDLPWTKDTVKEKLWRPVQMGIIKDKESTKDLTTTEPNDIYLVLSKHLSEKHGIIVEWPSNR